MDYEVKRFWSEGTGAGGGGHFGEFGNVFLFAELKNGQILAKSANTAEHLKTAKWHVVSDSYINSEDIAK